MDKKKLLLLGGAALIGYFILMGKYGGKSLGGGGVGTVTDMITGFTVTPDTPPVGGGDTTYNVTYPDVPLMVLPDPNFTGNGTTQLTETKKAATVAEKGKTVKDIQSSIETRKSLIRELQTAKTKKERHDVTLPFGLGVLSPAKGVIRMGW